jgi:hypothetical protein
MNKMTEKNIKQFIHIGGGRVVDVMGEGNVIYYRFSDRTDEGWFLASPDMRRDIEKALSKKEK